jgi:hypothetical protein
MIYQGKQILELLSSFFEVRKNITAGEVIYRDNSVNKFLKIEKKMKFTLINCDFGVNPRTTIKICVIF